MKHWIIVLALAATLGMSGFVDAAGTHKHGHGIHGKITAVTATTMTLTTGGKKNPHTITINLANATSITIDGVAGKIDPTVVGKYAKVTGGPNATDATVVDASAIVISSTRHHTKKAAA